MEQLENKERELKRAKMDQFDIITADSRDVSDDEWFNAIHDLMESSALGERIKSHMLEDKARTCRMRRADRYGRVYTLSHTLN